MATKAPYRWKIDKDYIEDGEAVGIEQPGREPDQEEIGTGNWAGEDAPQYYNER